MTSIKSYKKNISALWNNYNYVKKYDNYKYSSEDGRAYYLNGRRKVVVEYLKRISHGKKITMLELGFGDRDTITFTPWGLLESSNDILIELEGNDLNVSGITGYTSIVN